MDPISQLEDVEALDRIATPVQRLARKIPPGKVRSALNGVWLGHALHPLLVQVPVGAWLSATVTGLRPEYERSARWLTALGIGAAAPAVVTGATDWSEQHEQNLRVGVVHMAANIAAVGCFSASLVSTAPRASRAWRLAGLGVVAVSGLLGGHLSYRLAGGVNHAEAVPHVVEPGWHTVMAASDLPAETPVRQLVGEVPVVLIKREGRVHALADRCSHMSGPLSGGELTGDHLTCPWHGTTFCLADGSVVQGPGTSPQPVFEAAVVDGAVRVRLPGAG